MACLRDPRVGVNPPVHVQIHRTKSAMVRSNNPGIYSGRRSGSFRVGRRATDPVGEDVDAAGGFPTHPGIVVGPPLSSLAVQPVFDFFTQC